MTSTRCWRSRPNSPTPRRTSKPKFTAPEPLHLVRVLRTASRGSCSRCRPRRFVVRGGRRGKGRGVPFRDAAVMVAPQYNFRENSQRASCVIQMSLFLSRLRAA
jgi:hypothetical protein